MRGSKSSSRYLYTLLVLMTISIVFLTPGLGPVEYVYGATVITIGVGGNYVNVTEAIINNALADGVILRFVSDVYDYGGMVIQWNITIDGGGYTWLIEEPATLTGVGVYLRSTPTHRTGVSIYNLTILGKNSSVSGAPLTTILQGDAVEVRLINVTINEYTPADAYYVAVFMTYTDENFRLVFDNSTILNSFSDSIEISAEGNSYGEISVSRLFTNTSAQFAGGFLITARNNTVLNIYGSNLWFNQTYHGFEIHTYNSSRLNFYIDNMVSRHVNVPLWFILNTDRDNSIFLRNIQIYDARWGIMGNLYNERVIFTMENILITRVSSGTTLLYNGSRDILTFRNISIYNASFIGLTIHGINTTDTYLDIRDIKGNGFQYAAMYIYDYLGRNTTGLVTDFNVHTIYSGEGIRLGSYRTTDTYYQLSTVNVRDAMMGMLIQYVNSTFSEFYLQNLYATGLTPTGRGLGVLIGNSSNIYMQMDQVDLLSAGSNEGVRIQGINGTDVWISLNNFRISNTTNIGLALEVRDSQRFTIDSSNIYITETVFGAALWSQNSRDVLVRTRDLVSENLDQGTGLSVIMLNNLGNVTYIFDNIKVRNTGDTGVVGVTAGGYGDKLIFRKVTVENVSWSSPMASAISLMILGSFNSTMDLQDIYIKDADKIGVMIYGTYATGINLRFGNTTIMDTGFIGFGHYLTNVTNGQLEINDMRILNSTGVGFGFLGVNGSGNKVSISNLYVENVFDDQGAFPFVPLSNRGGIYIAPINYNLSFIGRNIWVTGSVVNTHMYINSSMVDSDIQIIDSYIPTLKMINSTATFIETYFDEENALLNNSILHISWTLDVYLKSNITNLPVVGASLKLYNGSILLDSGITNEDGIARLHLSYVINDTLRWITGSKFEISKDGENYTAYYILNVTLPSWYGVYNITAPIKTFLIKAYGYSNDGLIGVTVSSEEGILVRIYPLDLIYPLSPRNRCYDIKVLDVQIYGRYIQIDILMNVKTKSGDNWLPAKIFIDTERRVIYIFGPLSGEVHF